MTKILGFQFIWSEDAVPLGASAVIVITDIVSIYLFFTKHDSSIVHALGAFVIVPIIAAALFVPVYCNARCRQCSQCGAIMRRVPYKKGDFYHYHECLKCGQKKQTGITDARPGEGIGRQITDAGDADRSQNDNCNDSH